MKDQFNIVVAGVGGQGALLASRVLAMAAIKEGKQTITGEIHGLAQRGGAIAAHVRIGKGAHGCIIPLCGADVVLGMEFMEALRYAEFMSPDCTTVMSTSKTVPPIVWTLDNLEYPEEEEVLKRVASFTKDLYLVDSDDLAVKAGNALAANSAVLGALAGATKLPFSKDSVLEALKETVPKKALDANIKAFNMGAEEFRKYG